MKFSIQKDELVRSLALGTRSILTRSSLPVLSNVLIRTTKDSVEMTTTSLETAVRFVMPCKVERTGETTVLGRALVEFVSQLESGEVSIEKLGEEVVVACRGTSARFATIAPEEFPAIPKVEGGKSVTVDARDFAACVNQVFFCAAQDESRPILAGVLFEGKKDSISLVATDGFRLGHSLISSPKNSIVGQKFVVPARAVSEIPKLVADSLGDTNKKIEITVSDNLTQAVFKMEGLEFVTRLIDGVYPGWEKLIPANFATSVSLKKDDLARAVKVAAIFAKDAGNIVKFKISGSDKNGTVAVSSNTAQIGSSEAKIEVQLMGVGGEIAFNYHYVLEALASIGGEEIVFEMNESLNPGRLRAVEDETFFHIIMPVRLQS